MGLTLISPTCWGRQLCASVPASRGVQWAKQSPNTIHRLCKICEAKSMILKGNVAAESQPLAPASSAQWGCVELRQG